MLQLRCPICDAPIETHAANSAETLRCSRCGHPFAALAGTVMRPEANRRHDADEWTVHVPAFPGRRVLRMVQRLALARRPALVSCPACGQKVDRQARACPKCGRVLNIIKKRPGRWFSRAEWRTIGTAVIVFLGVPAAVIFFLVVLCAPHGH